MAENLKVVRSIGDPHVGTQGQVFDAVLPLGEEIKKLDPLRVGDCLAQPGELFIKGVLCLATVHRISYSIYLCNTVV